MFSVSRMTVIKWIKAGKLKAFKTSSNKGIYLLKESDVKEFYENGLVGVNDDE